MTMDRKQDVTGAFDEGALEALFAEARAETPEPLPDAFRARLVGDALAARPQPDPAPGGWLARFRTLLSEFGGAPSLAGMGAAGLAGVWIGFAAPGSTSDLVSTFWQGAASVSPEVSDWAAAGSDTLPIGDLGLLTLIETTAE